MSASYDINPKIIETLKNTAKLKSEEIEQCLSYFTKKFFKKKQYFLSAGEICHTKGYVNKGFDSMFALREQFGCTGENVYQGNNSLNELVIITQWGSPDQARSYGQSNELKEGMKKAAVEGPPNIWFVD